MKILNSSEIEFEGVIYKEDDKLEIISIKDGINYTVRGTLFIVNEEMGIIAVEVKNDEGEMEAIPVWIKYINSIKRI